MLLLRFTRVFSNMSLAISDLDGPSGEVCFLGGLRIPFIMCESMFSRPFGQHCGHCSSVAGFPRFRGKLWSKNELFSFQRSKNYLEISFSCLEKLCKRLQIFHVKVFYTVWFKQKLGSIYNFSAQNSFFKISGVYFVEFVFMYVF